MEPRRRSWKASCWSLWAWCDQLGIADTTPLLQFTAKRYFHVLADPKVNHYLIEQYVYPTRTVSGWVGDWDTYQKLYAHCRWVGMEMSREKTPTTRTV